MSFEVNYKYGVKSQDVTHSSIPPRSQWYPKPQPNWGYGQRNLTELTGRWICGTCSSGNFERLSNHMNLPVHKMTKDEWNDAIMNDGDYSMPMRVVGVEGLPEIQVNSEWHRIELEG